MFSRSSRLLALVFLLISVSLPRADSTVPVPVPSTAEDLDRKLLLAAKTGSEITANLTYLCDEIGPRLTGSSNLKRAEEWGASKMKAYGLTNVHFETWSLPEGWERGVATAKIIEPGTGMNLSIASMAWTPGTNGKVIADVVVMNAKNSKELAEFKGKLKNAVILSATPTKVLPLAEIDKPGGPGQGFGPEKGKDRPPQDRAESMKERQEFMKERAEFLKQEGAVAVVMDAGKPLNLLNTTGGFDGKERASASSRLPSMFMGHEHYSLLYRLASRPKPARTRIELEINNQFKAGPLPVHNVVGEIRGSDKPDEVVVVGGHLDSWDLAQGATDNGTGTSVVLETARILSKSGIRPRRTIRFILFTGEEQGLIGSKAYVDQHKDEMPRISAALVHDTGTGKVTGLGLRHRPVLRPLLEKELASLKDVGLTDFQAGFIGGSDHASFDKAGVPGLMLSQEMAGYRLSHHSQADSIERAAEADLIQGAQVMAVSAVRIANLDALLPREKPERLERPGRPERTPEK